jgi:hypothetical protein
MANQPALIFHYDSLEENPLTCGQLSSDLADRFLAAGGLADPQELPEPPVAAVDSWVAVGLLQWSLAADASIRDIDARCEALRLNNSFELVQRAMRELVNEWRTSFPSTADLSDNNLAQIIALGREMAVMIAESPDMIVFAKNEAQPVDLAVELQL